MEYRWFVPFTILAFILVPKIHTATSYLWRCTLCHTNGPGQWCCRKLLEVDSEMCCSRHVSESLNGSTYRALTPTAAVNRSRYTRSYTGGTSYSYDPSAWSVRFWNYESFITAASQYQNYGFGTTKMNGKFLGTMEIAALLAHVGSKVSCIWGQSWDEIDDSNHNIPFDNPIIIKEMNKALAGGNDKEANPYERSPVTCGLCNYKEQNPRLQYCDEQCKDCKDYPCAHGVAYYGRGALPIYWNYNYGEASKDLNVDLLNHPEYIEENATLAFLVAIWRWMTPIKDKQPSAHDVFIGNWEPNENDILANRVSGFGTTMNVLYGDLVCGHGENETSMNKIIDYYQHYLDLIGVDQKKAGSREVLSCAKQVAFNPSVSSSP